MIDAALQDGAPHRGKDNPCLDPPHVSRYSPTSGIQIVSATYIDLDIQSPGLEQSTKPGIVILENKAPRGLTATCRSRNPASSLVQYVRATAGGRAEKTWV
jgi:hypothetical protein